MCLSISSLSSKACHRLLLVELILRSPYVCSVQAKESELEGGGHAIAVEDGRGKLLENAGPSEITAQQEASFYYCHHSSPAASLHFLVCMYMKPFQSHVFSQSRRVNV